MAVDTTHPEYDRALAKWARARAVLGGEDAVKAAGERLLPRIASHDAGEYEAYKKRASFFNASARTASAFIGMIFRRPPFVKWPAGLKMARFETDTDLLGSTLAEYCREVMSEVIGLGRCGTLIDWEETQERPHCVRYRAEDILNWRVERVAGKMRATLIVLREEVRSASNQDIFDNRTEEQCRVLELHPEGYLARIYRKSQGQWRQVQAHFPGRHGKPLPAIPFVFHGARDSRATVGPLPLDDVMVVNLDHYRLDAEYKHGLHYTALPTLWAVGFQHEGTLNVGSASAWVSENPDARAGFLEFHGHGLTSYERALEIDERRLAVLGSRLLEPQKRQPETAEALQIRTSGEESVLEAIAGAGSRSLTDVLRWVAWWSSPENLASPEDLPEESILLKLNEDFGTAGLSAQDLEALIAAWQARAISQDTMLEAFRKGEVLPEGRTNAEEIKLLSNAPATTPEEQA
jgi:hypothetical protein